MRLSHISLGLLAACAMAQPPAPPSVRATGDAVVYVKPDQARLDVGVITQAATAEAAAAGNASQAQAVLEKLRAAVGSKGEIRTIGYSVSPYYQYPRGGGKPTIDGYRAVDTVRVTLSDLADAGKVVDVATQGGANQVQQLQFSLKDERPARAQALREAALEARANAEAMAGALGLRLGAVMSVEQGTPEVIRPRMAAMMAEGGAATPVEPGAIEVRASVTLVVAVQ